MKHQQVVIDYWTMVRSSCTCLLLAFCGYILIKMIQTVFWLPGYLQNNQRRLEELAEKYSVDLKNNADDIKKTDNIATNIADIPENDVKQPENEQTTVVEQKKIK